MNYWLYDREYVYPRIAKGLCRGHWLEGVHQGAAKQYFLVNYIHNILKTTCKNIDFHTVGEKRLSI